MPFYEYRCGSCGHEIEALQKITDSPLTTCPECGQRALKKLISAVGFRLKGSGWYETDFKGGKKKNLHESADKDKADKETSKTEKGKEKGSGTAKESGATAAGSESKSKASPKPSASS